MADSKNVRSTERTKAKAPQNRKNTKKGAPVAVIIIIAVAVIAAGIAAGYLIGRGSTKTTSGTNGSSEGLEVTSVESESIVGTPEEVADDVFTQELNGQNDEGLAQLAGENTYEDTAAILQGDGSFEADGMAVAEDDDTVVAEFNGGKVYRGEAAEEYNNLLAAYLFAGYSEEDVSSQLISETLENMVTEKVKKAHAEEMGLTELSDEDRQSAEDTATEEYAAQVAYVMNYVREDGMTDEEAQQAAQQSLEEYDGVTYDSLYNQAVEDLWESKLYTQVTKDVTVSEDDVRSSYDDKLALQQSSFEESRDNYELSQNSGEVIVYNLDGYRAIKMINVYMDEDAQLYQMELEDMASDTENTENDEMIAEMKAEMEACYQDCEALAQQALDALKSGTDFDTVYTQYSGDQEYTADLLKKTGYYISADSSFYEEEVIQAAMALKNPGDYSDVIRTSTGACVLMYVKDIQPGAVAYEEVHDDLQAEALEEAKENAFTNQCSAWVEEASPVYYEDQMY